MRPIFGGDLKGRPSRRGGGRGFPRVGCAHLHPFFKVGDHARGQAALGGHLVRFVLQRADQQTLVGLPRNNRRATFTPGQNALLAVEQQARLELAFRRCRLRMTFVAMLDQHRANRFLEKIEPLVRGWRGDLYDEARDKA